MAVTIANLMYHLHKEMEEYGNNEVIAIGSGAGYGKDVFVLHIKSPEGVRRIFVADNPVMDDWQRQRDLKKPARNDVIVFPDIGEGEKACFVITGGVFPPETLHTFHHTLRAFKEQETVILTTCLEFFNQRVLDEGYRLFAVSEKGVQEVVRGKENPSGRLINSTQDLRKLLLAGEFMAAQSKR